MIKIKRKEFIKFLKVINEMRSSHSRSMIDNAGDEDNTPIDATSQVSASQLSHALPNVEDPTFSPSSTPELRGAMMKIANEVPKGELEDFYRKVLSVFDETIDNMPEAENPFNPVTESVIRTLIEMSSGEPEDNDIISGTQGIKRAETSNNETDDDDVSGDPFNYEEAGPGVYIDLADVRGSEPLIKNMNYEAKQKDPNHVDTTVFEIIACAASQVFQNLLKNNTQFREDFEMVVDNQIFDSAIEEIQSLDTHLDPVESIEEALVHLIDVLGKAFLLSKLNVLEKVFGNKRGKDDVRMSVDVMENPESIRQVLSYDKIIPSDLHELAIAAGYFGNSLSKQDTLGMILDGFNQVLGDNSRIANMGRKRQKEIENGQLEIFLPKENKIDLTQFDEFGTYDKTTKTYTVNPEIRKLFNYITLVKGGEKEDIFNAAAYFYFTVARATYFANQKEKRDAPPPVPVQRKPGEKRRITVMPGTGFSGTLTRVDIKSNFVKEILRKVANQYINRLPEKKTLVKFLEDVNDLITDESGNITQDHSLKIGRKIIKDSKLGSDLSNLSSEESSIYTNSYYQITEIFRSANIKVQEVFHDTGKPMYNPEEEPFEWQFLSDEERKTVNSRLKGIELDSVDFLFRYIGHMISVNEEVFKILNRSSPETGGNFLISVPVITFAYIAPFILANYWQKTLADHWERYKPGSVMSRKTIDPDSEIRKIEKYFQDKDEQWTELAPFLGYSGASGVKQFYEQQVAHRFAFLDRHLKNIPTESGDYHVKILETIYDRLSTFLNDGLENYVKVLERAASDTSLSDEEKEYWSDLYELYSVYSEQMNEINDIVMDFSVFDTEGMEDQDWIFDDEDETIPTDVSEKFNKLLRETIPGKALRMLAHDITIKHPAKNESFMPEFASFVEFAAVEMMVQDPTLSLRGAQTEVARRQVANEVREYFSGKKVMPDFEKGGERAKNLVNNYGFTYDSFIKYLQNIARFVDKMFAKAMQTEKSKDISFAEFGDKIDAYVKKNIVKGSMRKQVDERLESLETSLSEFNDANNMERVTNIIDNYFIDAYDETMLEEMYESYLNIVALVKAEYQQDIDDLQKIADIKQRKSAADKLSKTIKKEVEKRRDPIQKRALALSKEMNKRKADNSKMQGKLI